jgi:hypothetical protein
MPTDDDLLPLLTPRPDHDAALRTTILAASRRPVRRRVWLRRATATAGLTVLVAASFFAGRSSVVIPEAVAAALPPAEVESAPEPRPVPSEVTPPVEWTAEQFELKAELATESADVAAYYRRAGDAFLKSRTDVKQAARCYRLHLAAAGPDGRAVAASDSWLLMALKN